MATATVPTESIPAPPANAAPVPAEASIRPEPKIIALEDAPPEDFTVPPPQPDNADALAREEAEQSRLKAIAQEEQLAEQRAAEEARQAEERRVTRAAEERRQAAEEAARKAAAIEAEARRLPKTQRDARRWNAR